MRVKEYKKTAVLKRAVEYVLIIFDATAINVVVKTSGVILSLPFKVGVGIFFSHCPLKFCTESMLLILKEMSGHGLCDCRLTRPVFANPLHYF